MAIQELTDKMIDVLKGAVTVAVLTGAGVSAESGIPTFRDALTGLWARYDSAELATPEAFERNPGLVTRWYDLRRLRCLKCEPNPAHRALVRLQTELEARGGTMTLITQNVDRLHQSAGGRRIIELHGSLFVWRCTRCGEEREERGGPFNKFPPPCEACASPRRPGVVWFGETLPIEALSMATGVAASSEVFFSIGTSAVVHPAAGLIEAAMEHGAKTIEINLEPTPITDQVDWSLRGPAAEILPDLVERAFGV